MAAAMEAVRKGSMSINKAALFHSAPHSRLQDHIAGRVVHGVKPGPKPYLSDKEECTLAEHLVEAAQVGYGKTQTQLKAIVRKVAQEKAILRSELVSDGWWQRFMK